MTPEAADSLRRAAAHALVERVDAPVLDDDAAHHLFRVLRIRDGDVVTVTDGAGSWCACRAVAGGIEPDGEPGFVARRDPPTAVAFAIPKQDRPEWIVQKLTELGIDRIVLLHADRSVVRWAPDRAAKHVAKLRRVAAEALQQSRGVWLPSIEGPVVARDVLDGFAVAEPGGDAARGTGGMPSAVAIGPEGGWSPEELAVAATTVCLGATVLRVETATIVAAARMIDHGP